MDENNTNIQSQKKNNGLGLSSFVLSLVGLIIAGIPCGILSIIFGGISIAKFNPETQKNKWMGIVGLIIGIIDVVLVITILPSLYESLGIL